MDPRKLREALRKQGIFVHESDPILEMAAICDATVADTLKAIEGVVKAAADRSSAAAAQTVDASRKAGDALINQGASFLVEQFREVTSEATAATRFGALRARHSAHMPPNEVPTIGVCSMPSTSSSEVSCATACERKGRPL